MKLIKKLDEIDQFVKTHDVYSMLAMLEFFKY